MSPPPRDSPEINMDIFIDGSWMQILPCLKLLKQWVLAHFFGRLFCLRGLWPPFIFVGSSRASSTVMSAPVQTTEQLIDTV